MDGQQAASRRMSDMSLSTITPAPGSPQAAPALAQFVADEMLRAPLLFDQLLDATLDRIKRELPEMHPRLRSDAADLLHAMKASRSTLADRFVRTLHGLAMAELNQQPLPGAMRPTLRPTKTNTLALVDEAEVAIDVELSHTIELIRSEADAELRELQTYTAALAGDMDLRSDHNPFRPESYARALWSVAMALPLSRAFHVQFMRDATKPLVNLLRQAYAASSSRLHAQGVEPAAYRTVILHDGMRRSSSVETRITPDFKHISQALSTGAPALRATPQAAAGRAGTPANAAKPAPSQTNGLGGTQAPPRSRDGRVEALVDSLFRAIRHDKRVPADVLLLITRLHTSALHLAAADAEALLDEAHPLWKFINRVAYEAEMVPDTTDTERARLLRVTQSTIEQLLAEPQQTAALYTWGSQNLEHLSRQRLERRCARVASQIGRLQKLEDSLLTQEPASSALEGALDAPSLDTVPADLMPKVGEKPPVPTQRWLDELRQGQWLQLFLEGRWVHAQLLWPGERREVWLLGDGASDTTWAIRRQAMAMLFEAGLMKGLTQRTLMRRAAQAVHEDHLARAA